MKRKKIPKVKIFGERNTGTNYLMKLIENNLDVYLLEGIAPKHITVTQKWILPGHDYLIDQYFKKNFKNNLGWKHTQVNEYLLKKISNEVNPNLFFITVTKNPYAWLLSLYNRPHHYKYNYEFVKNPFLWGITKYKNPASYTIKRMPFEKFLLTPWKPVKRENLYNQIMNPIKLWNSKNEGYLKLSKKMKCINLNYEELLAQPYQVIEKIQKIFGCKRINDEYVNIKKSTKGDNKDFKYYQNYYLEKKWRKKLNEKAIHIINKNLNKKILDSYGFKLETQLSALEHGKQYQG